MKLSKTEEKIYNLLKEANGKVVPHSQLLIESQPNFIRSFFINIFMENEDSKNAYFNVLKHNIWSIEKKLGVKIEAQNSVGYYLSTEKV